MIVIPQLAKLTHSVWSPEFWEIVENPITRFRISGARKEKMGDGVLNHVYQAKCQPDC